MGTSIFDDCGNYAGKLEEISKKLFQTKVKNGEPVTKLDKEYLDNEIFDAYQKILQIAQDGNSIALAIQNMANVLEKNGSIANIGNIAISSAREAIEKIKVLEIENENNSNVENVVATAAVLEILKSEDTQKSSIDIVFTEDAKKEIDDDLEGAKKGDIEKTAKLKTIEGAAGFLERFDTVDEKSSIGALAWMRRLVADDSNTAKALLNEFARKYNFDLCEIDEKGNSVVNIEKLEKLYVQKVSLVNPKASQLTKEDFKKIGIKSAQSAIGKGTYTNPEAVGLTAETMLKKVKDSSRISRVRGNIRLALEESKNMEILQSVAQENPDEFVQVLKEKVNASRLLMEKGITGNRIETLQREIMLLGQIVSEKDRNLSNTEEKNIKNPEETRKIISDDYSR